VDAGAPADVSGGGEDDADAAGAGLPGDGGGRDQRLLPVPLRRLGRRHAGVARQEGAAAEGAARLLRLRRRPPPPLQPGQGQAGRQAGGQTEAEAAEKVAATL